MGLFSSIGHIVGGLTGATAAHAAKGASRDQQAAIQAAIDEQNKGYGEQQQLWSPLLSFGMGAASNLNALANGDYSGFDQSPDYLYAQQEGNRALGQAQAARGNLFSGGAGRELESYNQGLATENLGNYRNSQFNQLNYGQNATNALSNALSSRTQGIADARIGIGNAQAGGRIGAANAYTQGAGNLLNYFSGSGYGQGGQSQQSGYGNSGYNMLGNILGPMFGSGSSQGVVGAGGATFSDRRLKSNIKRIGTHVSGLPWYKFEYIWGGGPQEGVMADEVLAVNPGAVSIHPTGYLQVQYGAL